MTFTSDIGEVSIISPLDDLDRVILTIGLRRGKDCLKARSIINAELMTPTFPSRKRKDLYKIN